MIAVRTRPKFKCDFCNYKATAPSVKKHEPICWRNPNRFCPTCRNTGIEKEWIAGDGINEPALFDERPCPYCSKRNDAKYEQTEPDSLY